MKNEIEILRILRLNPKVNKMHEVYETKDWIVIVLELIEGGDLGEVIFKSQKFSEQETRKIMQKLLDCIKSVHEQAIIIRDIKPGNIMFSGENLKLVDFGLSTKISDESYLRFKKCGTPYFAAPEITNGSVYNEKIDVYSAGVVMLCL